MTDAAARRSVLIERELPHPPEKVWRALTQSALIEEWLMKNDFEPVVGRKFTLRMAPGPHWNGVTDCEVLAVEPYRRRSPTAGTPQERKPRTGLKTVVTWTLTPTPRGVLLRMEQSGFREDQTANYQGAVYGWRKFFDQLERVAGGPTRDAMAPRYSTSGVVLALASTRWRLKSVIEANLNVPSLVSASIEPSAKIL